MSLPAVTRADWAERINARWQTSHTAILETGRIVAAAKDALDKEEFEAMLAKDLRCGASTARRLMIIAADHRLSDRAHVHKLPNSWGTLYELTKLDDETFDEKIIDGTINPKMERRDISVTVKKVARADREEKLGATQAPTGKFGVIVEDFEWDHEVWSEAGKERHASNHYPVSNDAHTAEEIVKRTRDRFAVAADDCVNFMWATVQHLAIAIDVMRQRGFAYVSHYVWGKDKIGLGHWNRNKHEILLIGVKGSIPCPAPGTQWDSLVMAPRREHSAKPERFLEMIEAYFPNLPKIELNRRGSARPGWTAWGNEASDQSGDVTEMVPPHDPETGEIIEDRPGVPAPPGVTALAARAADQAAAPIQSGDVGIAAPSIADAPVDGSAGNPWNGVTADVSRTETGASDLRRPSDQTGASELGRPSDASEGLSRPQGGLLGGSRTEKQPPASDGGNNPSAGGDHVADHPNPESLATENITDVGDGGLVAQAIAPTSVDLDIPDFLLRGHPDCVVPG